MKKYIALIAFLLIFALAFGCVPEKEPEIVVEAITVSFMDGDTVLKEESVEKGSSVSAFTPEKDGTVFVGWFATPSLNRPFDFSAALEEDTSIFAGFTVYMADARDFYLVGNGKSILLLESSWGAVLSDAHKLAKAEGANKYSITLDLLEGDQFQFAISSAWENQRGFGYMVTGNLPDGTPAFSGASGLGDSLSKNHNINVLVSGNYTFTLTTFPGDDFYDVDRQGYSEETKENYNVGVYDTITFTRNGDAGAAVEMETTFYIKGEKITGWADIYDDITRMQAQGDGTHILEITLEEGDAFLFTSMVKAGDIESIGSVYLKYGQLDEAGRELFDPQNPDDEAGSNLIAKASATYLFIYNETTGILTVTIPWN
ncbi:MAG: InlB B-repeat-containing protein [Clostridiales bacterium]|nr:InlB B-repeat-containing protein [Clostridiales bacterium]